jgi:signal transduction histidine kinase/CheY-like chemotaxis protein
MTVGAHAPETDATPDVAGLASAQTDVLAAIAFARARFLSPVLFVAMVVWSMVIEVIVQPVPVVLVVNLGTSIGVGITAIISRRAISPRWGHALCSVMWCAPVIATLFGQWNAPGPGLLYAVLVPLEMVAAAVLLDTRWVVGLLLGIQVFWIPLSLRANAHDAAICLMTELTALVFAVVMQIIMRRALLLHATTASELKVQLAERLRLEGQLFHAQRMEAIGTLAAGLAHDMNNVLASITSFASLLDGEVESSSGRADLEQIVAQSLRGAELTRGLLAFSRHGKYRKQALRIDDVVLEVLPILERTLPRSIAIRHQLSGATMGVEGDPIRLGQVLMNLSLNAAHAMDGKGTLVIAASLVTLDDAAGTVLGLAPGRYARFQVTDSGVGMDDATRRRVFEPFFTTKPSGQGTGLGLSTVWGIIQSHHGAVAVESSPGKGSTFSCYLPVTTTTTAMRPVPVPVPVPVPMDDRSVVPQRVGGVLIVDDEPAVRAGTARIVERMGVSAMQACNGEAALELYRQHGQAIDLVILDMGMPVMGGAECFRKLRELSQVPVLISTGYAVDADVQEMVARGAALIEKPFRSSDLVKQVARLLENGKSAPAMCSPVEADSAPVELTGADMLTASK